MSRFRFSSLTIAISTLLSQTAYADGVVNVYSYREPGLIEPLTKAFTANAGIEVKLVYAEKGLIERMEQEARLSPVDVLLSSDVTRLVEAAAKGLAQPVASDKIKANVPENLRDAGDQWFGLTMRARVVYAARERVKETNVSYENLADPKWKGKICTRPGDHPYTLGLVSFMIAKRGMAETKAWLTGLKANLAMKPNGNDRAQAKSVWAGECDLALANTYYMGLMSNNEKEPAQKEWAQAIRVLFPKSTNVGTHVNISGMLMAKNAPNAVNARAFMEFLASDEAQSLYASQNYEYPVNPKVKASETVLSWGELAPDSLSVAEIAKHQKEAAQLVAEVGFND